MMKVWDAYGRIAEIPREQWRTEVLPLNFRNAWNMPEELANLVDVTLDDGFIPDCLEPARKDWPALLAKDGDELRIYRLSDNHLLVLCAWHAQ